MIDKISTKKENIINNGGNGGEVFIFAKKISGDGLISVDGGNGLIGGNAGKVHIEAEDNNYKGTISAKGGNSFLKIKWWEKNWIQILIFISALITIVVFISSIYGKK